MSVLFKICKVAGLFEEKAPSEHAQMTVSPCATTWQLRGWTSKENYTHMRVSEKDQGAKGNVSPLKRNKEANEKSRRKAYFMNSGNATVNLISWHDIRSVHAEKTASLMCSILYHSLLGPYAQELR